MAHAFIVIVLLISVQTGGRGGRRKLARALQFGEAWKRAYESAAFADAKAADPGLEAAFCKLTRGGRKSRDHRYLRLEKSLKAVVLLLTHTSFKDELLFVLVPKENRVAFQTLLG